jgi:hypothetical protein
VGKVVDRALQLDKNDRFSDARSMQTAIRLLCSAPLSEDPSAWAERSSDNTTPESMSSRPRNHATANAQQSKVEQARIARGVKLRWRIVATVGLGLLGVLLGRRWLALPVKNRPATNETLSTVAASGPTAIAGTTAAAHSSESDSHEKPQASRAPSLGAAEPGGNNATAVSTAAPVRYPAAGGFRALSTVLHTAEIVPTISSAAQTKESADRPLLPNSSINTVKKTKLEVNDRSLDFRH